MPFELSCTDFTFHVLPHEKALHLIADLEIASCDLLFFPGCRHVQAQDVLESPSRTARVITRRVESAGLRVADVLGLFGSYRELSPNDPEDAPRARSRDAFERLLEFAHAVGAHGVTIVPGMDWPGETHETSLGRAGEEMSWRVEHGRAAGLRVGFEPHVDSLTETVDDALDLCSRAPGLTVSLDYSHLVYHGIPQSEIERLHPVTGHIHGRQGAPGVLQASSRTGSIDFGRIVRLFLESGFEGYFCLEYCCDAYNDMDRIDTVTETVRLRDLFRRVCQGLPAEIQDERFPWD